MEWIVPAAASWPSRSGLAYYERKKRQGTGVGAVRGKGEHVLPFDVHRGDNLWIVGRVVKATEADYLIFAGNHPPAGVYR